MRTSNRGGTQKFYLQSLRVTRSRRTLIVAFLTGTLERSPNCRRISRYSSKNSSSASTVGYSKTETFGSMTFILLLTRRSFGHSVGRRISVWSPRMFPVRGFLPATSSIVFIIKSLMVIRIPRRHAVIDGYS
jgi:hypothetical protein